MAWQKLGCGIWPFSFGIWIGCSNLARKEIRRSGQAKQLEFYAQSSPSPFRYGQGYDDTTRQTKSGSF